MNTILCSKELSLKINPDPTFQGITWINGAPTGSFNSGSGNYSGAGSCIKDRISTFVDAPTGPGRSILKVQGGSGVVNVPVTVPADLVRTRACKLVITATLTGTVNVATVDVQVDGASIAGMPAAGVTSGTFNWPFNLSAGIPHTLLVVLWMDVQWVGGPATPAHMEWNGYLYVDTYS